MSRLPGNNPLLDGEFDGAFVVPVAFDDVLLLRPVIYGDLFPAAVFPTVADEDMVVARRYNTQDFSHVSVPANPEALLLALREMAAGRLTAAQQMEAAECAKRGGM